MTALSRARYRGALLGLATGDALGTTVEFSPPGSFPPVTDMLGGGPFALEPGQWTDDTSMALCLAESLVACNGFDPLDQLERYRRWYREGHLSSTGRCFDIGNTVRTAIEEFERARNPFCGPTAPHTAGNGSIMRLAPVALFCGGRPLDAIERAADSSRTTHGATTAVDACRYLAAMIVGALRGTPKDELLSERWTPIPNYWDQHPLAPEIEEISRGSFKCREPPQIAGRGFVVNSLEAALWAFDRGGSFREGCLLAVNLGDDADTTGAVCGQLAGAFYGESGIPVEWSARLAMRDRIVELADRLWEMASERDH